MTFSEYAQGLSPYCSYGKSEADFFDELIGNFLQDAVMDSCKILERKSDTKYRYVKGDRKITPKDAQYLYDHRDFNKFSDWILNRMDESESYSNVESWLFEHNISDDDPQNACTKLLESIFLEIARSDSKKVKTLHKLEVDLKLINEIQEKIKLLPRPVNVPVPRFATKDEQKYINELYAAYGDAEGMVSFSVDDLLSSFPEYADDLEDRRIDFYAAETIRRGVLELGSGGLSDQFDVLKNETFTGVKDTIKRKQSNSNGYECMLAVMEQAVITPVTNYVLSNSPFWISGKVKKGVCHHLVNDGKLVWVRRQKKT